MSWSLSFHDPRRYINRTRPTSQSPCIHSSQKAKFKVLLNEYHTDIILESSSIITTIVPHRPSRPDLIQTARKLYSITALTSSSIVTRKKLSYDRSIDLVIIDISEFRVRVGVRHTMQVFLLRQKSEERSTCILIVRSYWYHAWITPA